MRIPKGISRRRKYFVDQIEPLWLLYGQKLSEEEQLVLNLSFGISGVILNYKEIAEHLNIASRKHPRILVEEALKKLKKLAQQSEREEVLG